MGNSETKYQKGDWTAVGQIGILKNLKKLIRVEVMGDSKPFKIRSGVNFDRTGITASTLADVIAKGCARLQVKYKPMSYPSIYDTHNDGS